MEGARRENRDRYPGIHAQGLARDQGHGLIGFRRIAELDAIQQAMAGPKQAAQAPTTHARPDPDKGLI